MIHISSKLTIADVGLKSFSKLHKAPDNRHTLNDLSFDPVTKRSPLGLKAPQLTYNELITCFHEFCNYEFFLQILFSFYF